MIKKYFDYFKDYKYVKNIFITASVFTFLSAIFFYGNVHIKNKSDILKNHNDITLKWKNKDKTNNHEEFFSKLENENSDLLKEIEKSGLTIKDIYEEESENGGKITITTQGTYRQIIDAFGIIRKNEKMNIPTIKKAKRNGTTTEFILEIRTLMRYE